MDEQNETERTSDPVFVAEQEHLTETYGKLEGIEHAVEEKIRAAHAEAVKDRENMLGDLSLNTARDEQVETLAEYNFVNNIVDTYNRAHDIDAERLRNARLLLRQPYFAKLSLQFRPGAPARDIYIGAAGMTDDSSRHFVVDWRAPVAEVYYNQENGHTSYKTDDGRTIEVDLRLRRQFDIDRDTLNSYFDTTVAISDPLLLSSLSKRRSDKLQAITTTIQREQDQVIRHEDVPALLVAGIAGSGKTSVLLQRIAYLFYRERETLEPRDVYLITPNPVFTRYIADVLPEMGESNPIAVTWGELMERLGSGSRGAGKRDSIDDLHAIDEKLAGFELQPSDFCDLRVGDERVVSASSVYSLYKKYAKFPTGTHRSTLVAEDLADKLEARTTGRAGDDDVVGALADLSDEDQVRIFGGPYNPQDENEVRQCALAYLRDRYAPVAQAIENGEWLRIDRIGIRLLGKETLSSTEWLYLKVALTGVANRSARYVFVDEVQDYTASQLAVLAKYFPRAHFLLLGDENQAIKPGTATFSQIEEVFTRYLGSVDTCRLETSYRSTPEITELFSSLMPEDERISATSVQRDGIRPRIASFDSDAAYAQALAEAVDEARADCASGGLAAIIANDTRRVKKLAQLVGDGVCVITDDEQLPENGVVLLDIKLAKGLEFNDVIIPDAQASVFGDNLVARHRLYTAISRATHKVWVMARGPLTPFLENTARG
ncbi:MAG: UvrD-helicase domain-containing protein [Eggerthellaceae bacterium]|jgi:DNA helicase-2/ATP-dependent DNA helicase PcrA